MFILKRNVGEKKDITIRGVNKTLYDVFTSFSKKQGLATGDAFNNLMFGSLHKPWRLHGGRKKGPPNFGRSPEIISNLKSLTVTKKDLTAVGEKTMFLFRNIEKLVFADDVDAETLVKHVKMIQYSTVTFPETIPRLIQCGLHKKIRLYNHPKDDDQLKDITIRNVSVQIYDEFLSKAKEKGKTTGEFFSEIINNHLGFFEISDILHEVKNREFMIISREEELTINKHDLELIGDRGIFLYRIGKLKFNKNVTQKQFLHSIIKVVQCEEVILPTDIPRLIVLSRIVNCKKTNIT